MKMSSAQQDTKLESDKMRKTLLAIMGMCSVFGDFKSFFRDMLISKVV